jgi:tetratricopeptide (TPR) repeat protein
VKPSRLRACLRTFVWLAGACLVAPLALGVAPPPEALELPEVVVRGIDRVRLEADRAGVLPLEAPRLAQAAVRMDLPEGALPPPSLGAAPPVQSPGCAYRNAVTGALARATGGAEGVYKSALERLSRDELDEAAVYLVQLRSDHPDHPRADDAAFWLAEIRRRQGRPDEALAFLRLVHASYAREAAYRLAWLLSDRGRSEEARQAWQAIAADRESPHAGEALYRLAADRLATGEPAAALQALDALRALMDRGTAVPDAVRSGYPLALGLARRDSHDLRGAEAALVRFLLESPDHPSAAAARVALGWTLLEEGKTREALQRFSWIVDAKPTPSLLARALCGKVRSLAELDDPRADAALLELEANAPSGPWVGWGRADLAWLAFRDKRLEDSLARYRSALEAWDAPGEEVPRYMVGECLYLLGRYDEAAKAYGAVPVDGPLGPAALHRAGLCELLAGRPAEAARLFEELLRRDPAYPQTDRVWAWLGEAYLQAGRSDEAFRAFNAVPEGSPAQPQAVYGRAWIAFHAERWDEAADLFGRFVRAYPADPNRNEALLTLARAHFNRRDLKSALDALDRLEAETESPAYRLAARYYRGWMYARSDRVPQAREVLGKLLAEDPSGPYSARAHQALAWLDYGTGDYPAALGHFEAIIRAAPGGDLEFEARQKRADCLYNLSRYDDALEAYRALGESPEGDYGQALCLFRLGRVDELAKAAEAFASRHPDDPRAADLFFTLAEARTQAGDPAAAALAYQRAAALSPEPEKADEARLEAARSAIRAGNPVAAQELLDSLASQSTPMGLAALRVLAGLFEEQGPPARARETWDAVAGRTEGDERCQALRAAARWARVGLDWAGAEQRLQAALAACPTGATLTRQALLADLGELRLLAGTPDQALEPLTEATELGTSPEGLRAFLSLGRAQETAKRPEEALETYLRIGYLYPLTDADSARALLRAGRLLEEQGAPERARAVYQKVLTHAGGEPAREARELLRRLPAPPTR